MECVLSLADEGTQLSALVATTGGAVLGMAAAPGPSNPRFIGRDELQRRLADLIAKVYSPLGDAVTLSAFATLPADEALLQDTLAETVPLHRESVLVGQFEPAALAGSMGTPELARGVVIRADVGSRGWAVGVPGREAERGGYGEALGDEGSAWWIGRRGIQAAIRASEKRHRNTQLKALLPAHFGVASYTALLGPEHEAPRLDRYQIASFAPRVFEAAAQDDEVSLEILEEAGRELAIMALALVNELDLAESPFAVLPTGSVFRLRGASLETFMKMLRNKTTKANLMKEGLGAPGGGVLLAIRHLGIKVRPETAEVLRSTLKARE